MDMISGIAVSNVGHGAPEVVSAVQEQAATFMHTMVYGEYVTAPQVELAQELTSHLDAKLDNVYFVNSGSEAVEGALKIAKKYTGRQGILAFHQSYHGSTHAALSVTGNPAIKEGYGPFLPGVSFAPFNDYAALESITESTACVIVEPIQGEAGYVLGQPCFLRALRERCFQTGALLIFDEIQTGFGRTGRLFAHQAYQVVPDILLCAKGMGAGMPIGAFISRKEIMQVITRNPVLGHITTFGGHPVSCAASLAGLKKILREKLMEQVTAKEQIIRHVLDHPLVREVRGRGLMLAVDIGSFEYVLRVTKRCTELGLLTDWYLNCDTAIRLAPPLTISIEELRKGMAIIIQALEMEA
ncbi:UNVERIFIED_CONTAM: hypothetical protein GTU68_003463 [Idotea baltica]|nr:hypothetical protein [Idotea baltica]